jgi:glutamine amidotransferase-like uncharacterized protein
MLTSKKSFQRLRLITLFSIVILLSPLFLPPIGQGVTSESSTNSDLAGIRVALYDGGRGFIEYEDSMAALYWMFQWMNATVDFINSDSIIAGRLDGYHFVVVPGGWAYDYYQDLGSTGITRIRDFVSSGGVYWGSCAGAFFACQDVIWSENGVPTVTHYGLNLMPGAGIGPIVEIADWPNLAMTEITLNKTNTFIDLLKENNTAVTCYWGGPRFNIDGLSDIEVIATYSMNDFPAMIAFEYDAGRVFLSGPHPEYEEDSFRDGMAWNDVLDDQGTEWNLCLKASLWLVANILLLTPPPLNPLMLMLFASGTAIILVVVIRIAIILRRKHQS